MERQYEAHQNHLVRRYGKIIAFFSIPALTFLLYQDLIVLKLANIIIAVRGIPILIGLAYLVILYSRARNNFLLVKGMHFTFLFSGMAMLSFLSLMTYGTSLFNGAIVGMVVVIFGILIGTPIGAMFLLPIYMIPFLFFIFMLLLHNDIDTDMLSVLINPFISIVAALILAEIQDRGRKHTFENDQTIKAKNSIIAASNIKMQKDLELARKVQHNLIPQVPPESNFYTLYTFYLPMHEVGGDYYDFIQFHEEEKIGIIIGDVSGHGVHAALITSMVKMLVETSGKFRSSPEKLFRYMNENLYGVTGENFFTAFYGIYDPAARRLTYARGGHVYPVIIREQGKKLEMVKSRGNLLGSFKNLTFEERDLLLEKGDKILFYTDGLTEARNRDGKEFEEVLYTLLRKSGKQAIGRIIQFLYKKLTEFKGDSKFEDDICMVGLEILQ